MMPLNITMSNLSFIPLIYNATIFMNILNKDQNNMIDTMSTYIQILSFLILRTITNIINKRNAFFNIQMSGN
jgi:hypothetical protein